MARRIEVELVADSSSLERGFKRSERAARDFNRNMERAARGGLIASLSFKNLGRSAASASLPFLSGAGIVAGMKSAVSAASDLNEQIGKTDVVFGASARTIEAWSKTTTEAFGLSRREALTFASTFGALFRPLGIGADEAARQSRRLTELGADLASFYNTNVADALDAIRSGIVGESEPLRRYGVLLSEARVQAEAMNETGKTTATQLTAQDKVLARIALIYRDSTKAQGDFARSSDRLAGQTKILQANVDDLQANLGNLLIPKLTQVVTGLNQAAQAAVRFGAATHKLGDQQVPTLGKSLRDLAVDAAKSLPLLGPTVKLLEDTSAALDKVNRSRQAAPPGLAGALGGGGGGVPGLTGPVKAPPLVTGLSNALQSAELDARLSGSRSRLRAVLEREAAFLREALVNSVGMKPKDRLALKQALLGAVGEIRSIDQEITDEMTAAADKRKQAAEDRAKALKDAAEKARRAAKEAAAKLRQAADEIKSALLDQFDRRQTAVTNRRALDDALKQLTLARQLGGPEGIRLALRQVQDARAAILRARLEAAPARLTRLPGGMERFALGNVVTINVHGTDSPEKVAREVVKVLQRAGRHTSTQSRGPAAGAYLGPH